MLNMKSKGDRKKTLSVEEYLNKIRPYLKDIINNLRKSDAWNIRSTIAINLIYSKDNDEECVMHSKSEKIEIMIHYEANKVVNELFESLKERHQNILELMKVSRFVFHYVYLLYYKCHEINLNRGGSYIDSPFCIKNEKATINPINKKIIISFNTL